MLVYETNAFNTQRMLIKKNAAKKDFAAKGTK